MRHASLPYARGMRPTVSNLVFNGFRKQVGKWWEDNEAAAGAITVVQTRREQSARPASAKVAIVFLCFVSANQPTRKSNLQKSRKLFQTCHAHLWRIRRAYGAHNRKNATRRKLWTTAKRPLSFPTVTPRQTKKQVCCQQYLLTTATRKTCTHPLDPASRPQVRAGFFMGLHRD